MQFNPSTYTVSEHETVVTVSAERVGNTSLSLRVDFATRNGTATGMLLKYKYSLWCHLEHAKSVGMVLERALNSRKLTHSAIIVTQSPKGVLESTYLSSAIKFSCKLLLYKETFCYNT